MLAIGTSALMKAFKNQGTPANLTWNSSGGLSMQPNGTTAEVTGIAASETAWDANVHSVSVDYPEDSLLSWTSFWGAGQGLLLFSH